MKPGGGGAKPPLRASESSEGQRVDSVRPPVASAYIIPGIPGGGAKF